MITQQDVDNAKAAADSARALLEAYWNGNPDGNYSVIGWAQELGKCSSQNPLPSRNSDLTINVPAYTKGGCTNSNFNLRLTNFTDRVKKYVNTLQDYNIKLAAYNKILKDFSTQSATNVSNATAQNIQAQTAASKTKYFIFGAIIIVVIVAGIIIYRKFKK